MYFDEMVGKRERERERAQLSRFPDATVGRILVCIYPSTPEFSLQQRINRSTRERVGDYYFNFRKTFSVVMLSRWKVTCRIMRHVQIQSKADAFTRRSISGTSL